MVVFSLLKVLAVPSVGRTIIFKVDWTSLIEEDMESRFMPKPGRSSEDKLTWEQVMRMSKDELIMMFDEPYVSMMLSENKGIDDHTFRFSLYMMKAFVVKVNISTMYRGEYNRVRSEYLIVDEPQEKVIENINLRLFCEEANVEYVAQGQTNQVGVIWVHRNVQGEEWASLPLAGDIESLSWLDCGIGFGNMDVNITISIP